MFLILILLELPDNQIDQLNSNKAFLRATEALIILKNY